MSTPRRRRPGRRAGVVSLLVVGVAAVVALAIVVLSGSGSEERTLVSHYVRAWSERDYPTMYGLLDEPSHRRVSEHAFAGALGRATSTATVVSFAVQRVGSFRHGVVPVVVVLRTHFFGTLREAVDVPVGGTGTKARVHFSDALVFPGMRAGEHLVRHAALPPRAAILASDGSPLATGPDRSSPQRDVASAIVGALAPIPSEKRAAYAAAGYPSDAKVGSDGLERIFEAQLAGTPGEALIAGHRVLARRPARAGAPVKTTIDPGIERSLLSAMAGRYAGIVALDPRTGGVLGAAGVGFSGLQPPGSTMKIVTTTGVLEAKIAGLGTTFPISTEATIDGFRLQNAGGEACGGTLLNAFAVSCNAVFAPLGVKLGASRFLAVAKRYGFNTPSPIATEPSSTIPAGDVASSSLELGASAIGQGKVQATALQMADAAATVADHGRRPIPTLLADQPPRFVSVTSPGVAADLERMMIAVVTSGTGTAAQISGVQVAGKTGTAELRSTVNASGPNASSPANTDSWFVAFAPAPDPEIVVGALFPGQGAGGATAAPAARGVLLAGLHRS